MPAILHAIRGANVQMVSGSRWLAECFAAIDPKISSVRISQGRQSPDSFGKARGRRQQDVDIDYRFGG
jgi:hypothetical protein